MRSGLSAVGQRRGSGAEQVAFADAAFEGGDVPVEVLGREPGVAGVVGLLCLGAQRGEVAGGVLVAMDVARAWGSRPAVAVLRHRSAQ